MKEMATMRQVFGTVGSVIIVTGTVLATGLLLTSCTGFGNSMRPRVIIETTLGDIELELDAEKAPITVLNFIQYSEDQFYEETIFHRVISRFMIQGGGFTAELDRKTDGLRADIKNEWPNGLKNVRGAIAMARLGGKPDSANSQFFINVVDNPQLDQPLVDESGYCVFGKVVKGMDTVDRIRDAEVSTHPKYAEGQAEVVPVSTVLINSIRLVSEFDRSQAQAAAEVLLNGR